MLLSKLICTRRLVLCVMALSLVVAQGALSRTATAAGFETGCGENNFGGADFYDAAGRKVFDDERYFAFAFRLNTPVYQDSTGNAPAARPLAFSERVRVMGRGEGTSRLPIKDVRTRQPLGWVERDSVLCNTRPATDSRETGGSGLYKRVVVRTDTALQGQVAAKSLYQTPDQVPERCSGGCAAVSRFQWYFIYAEDNGHYLISEFPNLELAGANLMGWLPKGDGYVWDTALGLRPDEKLAGPNGVAEAGSEEKHACVYSTMEKLAGARPEDCNQVLGGKRWFGLDVRMAVLKQSERAYEVLFSNAETAGRDNAALAEGLNKLDVFFVIDGTKSMQPAIQAMKDLTNQISEKMASKTTAGGVVRYGFRIYRDSNMKSKLDGVANSEALPLSRTVCDKTNLADFKAALNPVRAYDPDEDDDFPENTFGGLAQAADDIYGCPSNTKLVFMIGDAGYDPAKQASRGFQPYTDQTIAERLSGKEKVRGSKFDSQPILIFIEPPRETSGVSNQANYDKAYAAFESQARSILSKIYGGTKLGSYVDNNFIRLDQSATTAAGQQTAINTTLHKIDDSLNPAAIQAIQQGIRAGESLVSIIERLRNNSSLNIPINFLDFADAALCSRIGEQCRTGVLEAVNHGFVPVDNPADHKVVVVPEVLLSRDQLDQWLKLLYLFKSFSGDTAGHQGRDQLVNTLFKSISILLQLDMASDRISMADKVQFQAGLPNAGRSPMMQYSDNELRDVNAVPSCEIENLKQYAIKKYDVLNTVFASVGKYRPVYTETAWPEGACPMSPKGKNVPFIDGDVRGQALNASQQTNYSMAHKRGQEFFFWMPVGYMP